MNRQWVFVLIAASGAAAAAATTKLPSNILPDMLSALTNGAPRATLVEYLDGVQTDKLSAEEQHLLGEAWFVAGRPEAAREHFATTASSTSDHARLAAARLILIELNARQNVSGAEQMVAEYRRRFSPDPGDLWGLYHAVNGIAGRYRASGDHERAVQIVLDELAWADPDLPHPSFHLPFVFLESFEETGRKEEAMNLLSAAGERLRRQAPQASGASPGQCLRMEDVIDLQAGSYRIGTDVRCDLSYRYTDLLEALGDALDSLK